VCVTEPCRYADPNRYEDDDEQLRFLTVHLKSLGKLNYQSAMGWLIFVHTAKPAYFKFQILMNKGLVDYEMICKCST
jgi:hypothetical protein